MAQMQINVTLEAEAKLLQLPDAAALINAPSRKAAAETIARAYIEKTQPEWLDAYENGPPVPEGEARTNPFGDPVYNIGWVNLIGEGTQTRIERMEGTFHVDIPGRGRQTRPMRISPNGASVVVAYRMPATEEGGTPPVYVSMREVFRAGAPDPDFMGIAGGAAPNLDPWQHAGQNYTATIGELPQEGQGKLIDLGLLGEAYGSSPAGNHLFAVIYDVPAGKQLPDGFVPLETAIERAREQEAAPVLRAIDAAVQRDRADASQQTIAALRNTFGAAQIEINRLRAEAALRREGSVPGQTPGGPGAQPA